MLRLLAVSLAALLVTGCAASAATDSGSVGSGGDPAGGKSDVTILNVGDQQQDLETLFQASGALTGAPFKVRALKSAGLTQADVHQVNVSLLELGTVLESGSADASVVSVEQKVDYQQTHPTAKVLANVDTVSPPSYGYLLGTTAALGNPAKLAAISDFIKRLIKAENWEKSHRSQWVTDYYVNVEHQTPEAAKLILAAGGTQTYEPITPAVQAALQDVVNLMVGAGAWPKAVSVASLYGTAQSRRYNAILKEVPQNG